VWYWDGSMWRDDPPTVGGPVVFMSYFTSSKQPYRCPVCKGTGVAGVPPGIPGDQPTFVSSSSGPWECRACCGTGIVWG
jgi:hypothetical protein